jgi:hypothetical protein
MALNNISRKCLPCSACCQGWLKIETPIAKASFGNACQHCSSMGCTIYESRPVEPCQKFVCAWLSHDSDLPAWMRPDSSHAIVMTDRLRWNNRPVITVTYTVSPAPSQTRDWLYKYSDESGMPLVTIEFLSDRGKTTHKKILSTHGPKDFSLEIMDRFNRGEQLW